MDFKLYQTDPHDPVSNQFGVQTVPFKPLTALVLQLCSWHAAEAIKKKLTREGYPQEKRKELANLIWAWIKSPTLDLLERNRGVLLNNLHQKEQNYLQEWYQRQEHQFVTAYTRSHPNLGCSTTQRGESMHPMIKEPITQLFEAHDIC